MIEQLIQILQRIEANEDIKDYEDDAIPLEHPDVINATSLAEHVLITNNGHTDWEQVEILRTHGYCVYPLEKDRFGWLIGGIATKKGTVAFG